jgi:hypothetical protein
LQSLRGLRDFMGDPADMGRSYSGATSTTSAPTICSPFNPRSESFAGSDSANLRRPGPRGIGWIEAVDVNGTIDRRIADDLARLLDDS